MTLKMVTAKTLMVLTLFSASALSLPSAQAFEGWRHGHWMHDRHEGRLGWWWVAGPSWTYYARPYPIFVPQPIPQSIPQTVIVQQSPPQVVVESAPASAPVPQIAPQPVLYYCKATETYYPDTMSCPGGWSVTMAGVPPSP